MSAIETRGLTKRYGPITALDGLDLTVREGEVFGFLGPNGAGKSTTIDLLLGFLAPSAGEGSILGYDIATESRQIRKRIGLLPEGYSTYERVTGREHVEYAIETKDADNDPETLLDRVGLAADARDRRAGEYSKGMTQRLALAMALAGDPELLILDEPSSGLDPSGMRELRTLVRDEAESGTTVFFSSHLLSEVEAVCDRVGILQDGHLAVTDTIDRIRSSMNAESTVTLEVDSDPGIDLADVAGVSNAVLSGSQLRVICTESAAKAEVIRRVSNAATVRDVTIADASLTDVFERVTGTTEDRSPTDEKTDRIREATVR